MTDSIPDDPDTGATGPREDRSPSPPPGDGAEDAPAREIEDLVTEFLLAAEEGGNPSVDAFLARHPRHAEDLAVLLGGGMPPAAGTRTGLTGTASRRGQPPAPGAPGSRIGPFEIERRVASGGGGTVYRARHAEDGYAVALKVLRRGVVQNPRDFVRFEREARFLRGLDLASIVPVLATGETEDCLYIAMRWIDGRTLAAAVTAWASGAENPPSFADRARLIAALARALHLVHGRGILHRDVKPHNIMVDASGAPVILDFGIAREGGAADLTVTSDGPIGTPRYLAPECLSGRSREAGPPADIWGLGVTLFELCTLAPAFVQTDRGSLFRQIAGVGPPRPRTLDPGIPKPLEAIILRATEIAPRRRYATMAELAADLEAFAAGVDVSPLTLRRARPVLRFARRHAPTLVAAALVLAAGTAFGLHAAGRRATREACLAVVERCALRPPELGVCDRAEALAAIDGLLDLGCDDPGRFEDMAWAALLAGAPDRVLAVAGNRRMPAGVFREILAWHARRVVDHDDPGVVPTTMRFVDTGNAFESHLHVSRRLPPPFAEVRGVVERAEAAYGRRRPKDLAVAGWFLFQSWMPAGDREGFEAAVVKARLVPALAGGGAAEALSAFLLGLMDLATGQPGTALTRFQETGTRWSSCVLLYLRGVAHALAGHPGPAAALLEQALPGELPGGARTRACAWLEAALRARGEPGDAARLDAVFGTWWVAARKSDAWVDMVQAALAESAYRRSAGDLRGALGALERVVALEDAECGRASAAIHERLEDLYFEIGDVAAAKRSAEAAVANRKFERKGVTGVVRPFGMQLLFGLRDVERPANPSFHAPEDAAGR